MDINRVYNISPKKDKKSDNASSILQTEARHKLQEALKSVKKNTHQQYTNKSNTHEHTHSDTNEHQNNVFQHNVIITKQDVPTIYIFHSIMLQTCKKFPVLCIFQILNLIVQENLME